MIHLGTTRLCICALGLTFFFSSAALAEAQSPREIVTE